MKRYDSTAETPHLSLVSQQTPSPSPPPPPTSPQYHSPQQTYPENGEPQFDVRTGGHGPAGFPKRIDTLRESEQAGTYRQATAEDQRKAIAGADTEEGGHSRMLKVPSNGRRMEGGCQVGHWSDAAVAARIFYFLDERGRWRTVATAQIVYFLDGDAGGGGRRWRRRWEGGRAGSYVSMYVSGVRLPCRDECPLN